MASLARRPSLVIAAAGVARVLLALLLALGLPLAGTAQTPGPTAQPSQYAQRAAVMLRNLSPAERVGQLFVVSYLGNDAQTLADLNDLIVNYRIGGVQLRVANQNFANGPDGARQLLDQVMRLQAAAAARSLAEVNGYVQAALTPTSTLRLQEVLPLFIAVAQEGDGAPNSDITQGLSALPSQLTLGATFKPERAEAAGRILGNELEKIGVNLLLGPVLDVLEQPRPGTPGDPGTRVFGSDPYWVGQLGAGYISGVRAGSRERVAVVAKNFPGLGSADRNVEEEIPTVQKSLEQLRQTDLAAFFPVLAADPRPNSARADGLLMTHIRYRGFQGNIRANTRPVSLDPQAFDALMKLPELAAWRMGGGVMFSDQLGLRSVRRYDDPTERSFNARKVAQDAFLAGNDVMLLGNFALTNNWPDQLANIKDTLNLFRDQYGKDRSFAARVDASVLRVLALKLRMYGNNFTLSNVLPVADRVPNAIRYDESTSREINDAINLIAKESVTLLSPSVRELPVLLPSPPGREDTIVFLIDDRTVQECVRCVPYPALRRNALQDAALNLYGPRTTGQLNPSRLSTFNFSELAEALRSNPTTTATSGLGILTSTLELGVPVTPPTAIGITNTSPARTRAALDAANWIVIGMIDTQPAMRSSAVIKEYLAARGDALRDKRVIVFSFGPPYYLDATEVSKVSAYYGVYSRTPASIDAAVRAWFGEFVPAGRSPVNVSALNYSLVLQTSPNPTQIIPLRFALLEQTPIVSGTVVSPRVSATITPTLTVPPTGAPAARTATPKIGDRLRLTAGPILDRDGRIVPDGTPVQFILSLPADRIDQSLPLVSTRGGQAETIVVIDRKGRLELRVESNEARLSDRVLVNVADDGAGEIVQIRPTAMPSPSPVPVPTATAVRPTELPAATSSAVPTPAPARMVRANFNAFIATLALLVLTALLSLSVLSGSRRLPLSFRWRAVLWSWLAGWLAYILVALGAPGTNTLVNALNWAAAVILAVIAAVVVLLFAVLRRLALASEA